MALLPVVRQQPQVFHRDSLDRSSTMSNHDRHSVLKEGIAATTTSDEEVFTINIIIPPKPKGMNPDSRPSSPIHAGLEGELYAEGPCKVCAFQVMAAPLLSTSRDRPRTSIESNIKNSNEASTQACLTQHEELAGSKLPFVWKLYEMLEDIERTSREDIISWVDGGRAFKVHKMDEFLNDIIPQYFRQSKYKSFQRQLYFYNFQRVSSGAHAGAYTNPNFQKGDKAACLSMVAKKSARRTSASKRSKSLVEASSTPPYVTPAASTPVLDTSRPPFTGWIEQMESLLIRDLDAAAEEDERHNEELRRSSWPSYGPAVSLTFPTEMEGEAIMEFEERPFHFVNIDFEDLGPRRTDEMEPNGASPSIQEHYEE